MSGTVSSKSWNAFDSGSCSEQRKGSLLFVLGPDPGFATASSIIDVGAMSVT